MLTLGLDAFGLTCPQMDKQKEKKGKIISNGSLLAPGRIGVWKTTMYHEDTHRDLQVENITS